MTAARWRNVARGRPTTRLVAAQAEPLIHDVRREGEGGLGVVDTATWLERSCLGVEGEDGATVDVELANLELDRYLRAGTLKYPKLALLSGPCRRRRDLEAASSGTRPGVGAARRDGASRGGRDGANTRGV